MTCCPFVAPRKQQTKQLSANQAMTGDILLFVLESNLFLVFFGKSFAY